MFINEHLTGTFPYRKSILYSKNCFERKKISLIQDESLQLLQTICWTAEPENRPTFDEIVTIFKKGIIIKTPLNSTIQKMKNKKTIRIQNNWASHKIKKQ